MRLHFQTEQWLPYPTEQVFAFFADPDNLPRLMPGWQRARIAAASFVPPTPPPQFFPNAEQIRAGTGTQLDITIRPVPLLPFRAHWLAQIEDFRWNQGFCDVQLKGPFRYWRHCHSVEPAAQANQPGTLLRDAVEYEPPFGLLGTIADRIAIRRQLAATFRYRQKRTLELLAQPQSAT